MIQSLLDLGLHHFHVMQGNHRKEGFLQQSRGPSGWIICRDDVTSFKEEWFICKGPSKRQPCGSFFETTICSANALEGDDGRVSQVSLEHGTSWGGVFFH